MSWTWDEVLRERQDRRSAVRKQYRLTAERLKRLKASSLTRRIVYPEMQDAFDYVHAIYPFANVKQSLVYHCNGYSLAEVGYTGVGGFYDISNRVVVVTDYVPSVDSNNCEAVYTLDEVLCHELIHYAANFKNASSSREVEEEIAYGKSINYLRKKGRSDEFIIEKNMMPYLLSVVDHKSICHRVLIQRYSESLLSSMSKDGISSLIRSEQQAIAKETIVEAKKLGAKMISLYGDRAPDGPLVKQSVRKLDLSDDF